MTPGIGSVRSAKIRWNTLLPKIIFDTTGINRLEDGGGASAPLMRGLACGFDVILTVTSVGELIATRTPERREALLRRCDWLLQSARCIWEPKEVMAPRRAREPSA